jgi:hypothetical protein
LKWGGKGGCRKGRMEEREDVGKGGRRKRRKGGTSKSPKGMVFQQEHVGRNIYQLGTCIHKKIVKEE